MHNHRPTDRLEYFSDAVLAIAATLLATNRIEKVYRFDGVLSNKSYINDVRVDTDRRVAYLYISCSQINKQPDYNEGENKRTTPYAIYRMKLNL